MLGHWPITYTFDVSWPETGVTVADITGINREGFQYLDIYRRTIESGGKKVEVPHTVYVHQVYPYSDFTTLASSKWQNFDDPEGPASCRRTRSIGGT